ncbi:MAG: thioredoxin domain-containing protein [Anaerolineaceae bacterium]|nr:thioredoxin domain-containing protein [Anaerolineaceae bacterium]
MNHLANQTSPYLLQHKNNPVEWYPWNELAINKAKVEKKPIFLSIGYSACHWCHVMAHESFENPITAELLNQYYISIKVDREERPDIDQIYMTALVALTGQGGWPLSIFLTPDLQPFYGGTYFPPISRYGMPAFSDILRGVHHTWQSEPEKIHQVAVNLTAHIQKQQLVDITKSPVPMNQNSILELAQHFLNRYDWEDGGWGEVPKFPAPMTIDFLLQCGLAGDSKATEIAINALQKMSMGGIFDLVEGGFHRYSTDKTWTVPHFEKMLYDNAQLASSYIHAYQATGNIAFRNIAESTLNFLQNKLRSPSGGFYSSQDADSDGREGTYYLWTKEQLLAGDIPQDALSIIDLPERGHLESQYLLKIKSNIDTPCYSLENSRAFPPEQIHPIIKQLLTIRGERTAPEIDDKIILSWNALTIIAFIEAGLAFDKQEYLETAIQCADFLISNLFMDDKLSHTWRENQASDIGFLEDYGSFSSALLMLYQATSNTKWLGYVKSLLLSMTTLFAHESGFLQNTSQGHPHLLTPILEFMDMVTPSGMAQAVHALLLYSWLEPQSPLIEPLHDWLNSMENKISAQPAAYAYWLQQSLAYYSPQKSFIFVYHEDDLQILHEIRRKYNQKVRPGCMFLAFQWDNNSITDHAKLLQDKNPIENQLTLYLCENNTCQAPITDYQTILSQLD